MHASKRLLLLLDIIVGGEGNGVVLGLFTRVLGIDVATPNCRTDALESKGTEEISTRDLDLGLILTVGDSRLEFPRLSEKKD